jgi:lipopolysaccharide transport system permease protein
METAKSGVSDLAVAAAPRKEPAPERRASELRPEQIIEPPSGWVRINWKEIWRYRELLYFLTWRDVKVRYKQTVLGAAWAILQPVLSMLVFTLFFGKLAGLEDKTGGVAYPVWVYAGLVLWTFFSSAVSNGAASLVGSSNLITKVYFPRLIVPLAAVGAALVDLVLAFLVLLGMMPFYQLGPKWQMLLAPLFVVGALLASAAVGTALAALTVAYRDFRYVVPFLVQILMFVSAVMYPLSIVPEVWRPFMALNPMTGMIEGFRAALFGSEMPWLPIAVSFTVAVVLFFLGAGYFRNVERRFADII